MLDASRQTPNTSPRRAWRPQCVVIHATAGEFAGSLSWLTSPTSRVSADALIDRDGRVVVLNQTPAARYTWHAGISAWRGVEVTFGGGTTLNPVSVGIELVNRNDGRDPYPPPQIEAALALTALYCAIYRIPVERVCGHYECAPNRKTDPAGLDMQWFRSRLARAMSMLFGE